MNRNIQSFSEILATLEQLARKNKSGTLFVTTDNNHSVRFVLEDGEITAMAYRQLRGYDALSKLQQIRGGSFRFVEGRSLLSIKTVPLPKTDELLAIIREGIDEGSPHDAGRKTIPAGLLSDTLVLLAIKREELILHLGPFAEVAWDDYIEDNGMPMNQAECDVMIQEMAANIDNPEKRQEFKRKAMNLTR